MEHSPAELHQQYVDEESRRWKIRLEELTKHHTIDESECASSVQLRCCCQLCAFSQGSDSSELDLSAFEPAEHCGAVVVPVSALLHRVLREPSSGG